MTDQQASMAGIDTRCGASLVPTYPDDSMLISIFFMKERWPWSHLFFNHQFSGLLLVPRHKQLGVMWSSPASSWTVFWQMVDGGRRLPSESPREPMSPRERLPRHLHRRRRRRRRHLRIVSLVYKTKRSLAFTNISIDIIQVLSRVRILKLPPPPPTWPVHFLVGGYRFFPSEKLDFHGEKKNNMIQWVEFKIMLLLLLLHTGWNPVRPFSFSQAAWVAPKLVNVTFYKFFYVRFDKYFRYGASLGGTLCYTSKTCR